VPLLAPDYFENLIMRKLLSFLLLASSMFLSSCGGAQGANAPAAAAWKMVWSDEFNGTSLDSSKWTLESGGTWYNNELQYYTAGDNIAVQNGVLTITARLQNYGGRQYTSSRLKTQGKASWTYGKVEARIKLPYGQGMWPAFWMLGDNIDTVQWPQCGEIDIMEMVGGIGPGGVNRNAVAVGSLHRPNSDTAQSTTPKSLSANYNNPGNVNLSDDFHVFSIEWDASAIKYLVDGNVYQTIDISSNSDGFEVFRKPFFIVLNLAVGGDWPGSPDQTTVWPQQMQIDWVHVYQK
jgi:beta-glucanase (GH16 family)